MGIICVVSLTQEKILIKLVIERLIKQPNGTGYLRAKLFRFSRPKFDLSQKQGNKIQPV